MVQSSLGHLLASQSNGVICFGLCDLGFCLLELGLAYLYASERFLVRGLGSSVLVAGFIDELLAQRSVLGQFTDTLELRFPALEFTLGAL